MEQQKQGNSMAVKEYQYQPATHDSLHLCLCWAQNNLELRDWNIRLDTSDEIPRELLPDDASGKVIYRINYHTAMVWVPIGRCKAENMNPYSILLHEAIHIRMAMDGFGDDEATVCMLEPILYRLYTKETKLRQAKERTEE